MNSKQTRKAKLRKNAEIFANQRLVTDASFVDDYIACYERGYRDAMRDARRAVRNGDWTPLYDSEITKFLRPIR